jgi:hypothetical protein
MKANKYKVYVNKNLTELNNANNAVLSLRL